MTRTRLRKCKACGELALGPLKSRTKLLEAIVQVDAELKRRDPPHPVPPDVLTYEQLERHERLHEAEQRGRALAVLERVLEPDVEGICWDCGHKRRMAEYARARAEADET